MLAYFRRQGQCDLAGVTTADLVDAFGNDTELTLSMAKRMLTHGLVADGQVLSK